MRIHRLIAILLLVESRGRMKAKDLAFALETSVRSIYRDIDILAEAGIPLVTTPGPGGGIYLMEGYTVNLKQLNGEDVVNLYLTGMGIYAGGQTESGLKLKNALLKLEQTLPPSYQTDIKKAKARFYFDDTPWWTERVIIPCLEILRLAVWRSRKIKIHYSKVNGENSLRIVQPYGLVVKKADWYLVAYCQEVQDIRTFKCARIIRAEQLEEDFVIPPDFSLEQQWSQQETSFKQVCKEQEYYPVVIKVDELQTNIGSKLEVVQTLHEGRQLVMTVNMFSWEAASKDVIEIIGQVEVIEPPVLRQFVREHLMKLQELYV
ncbi:MAG: WYL domain-containing protein [Gorillibacterium sp.]|nr:WYL domain-containing protein [Gorillibacterium sp.]